MLGKKSGALRWLDPDWSLVRWVRHFISGDDDEEEERVHQYHGHPANQQNSLGKNYSP